MVNVVAIPSRSQLKSLKKLIEDLLDDDAVDRILIMDNGYHPAELATLQAMAGQHPSRLAVKNYEGWSIYEMWNAAFLYAWALDKDANLALFNDDLRIATDIIRVLSETLSGDPSLWVVSPDYLRPLSEGMDLTGTRAVRGTFKNHGMAGFAFMFNVGRFDEPPFDESFAFWGGDDAFSHLVTSRGGNIGIVQGLPIEHVGGATSNGRPEIPGMIEADIEKMKRRNLW